MKPKLTVDFKFKLKIFINLKKIIKNMNLNQKILKNPKPKSVAGSIKDKKYRDPTCSQTYGQ